MQHALDQLQELRRLTDGWLDGTAEAPTSVVMGNTESVLHTLEQTSLIAPMVSPLSVGGIHLEWQKSGKVSYIDIENDGSLAVTARYDGVSPESREFESMDELLQHVVDLKGLI